MLLIIKRCQKNTNFVKIFMLLRSHIFHFYYNLYFNKNVKIKIKQLMTNYLLIFYIFRFMLSTLFY